MTVVFITGLAVHVSMGGSQVISPSYVLAPGQLPITLAPSGKL